MTVQLDESINLEDLDRIRFGDLVSKSTNDGEDTFESEWKEESSGEPESILCLDEDGEPYFQGITTHSCEKENEEKKMEQIHETPSSTLIN